MRDRVKDAIDMCRANGETQGVKIILAMIDVVEAANAQPIREMWGDDAHLESIFATDKLNEALLEFVDAVLGKEGE